MTYLRRLWAYLQQLLGVDPSAQSHAPPRPLTPQNQPQSYAQALLAKFSLPPIGPFDPQSALSALLSTFTAVSTDAKGTDMAASFTLPNLPREEKLSYIEAQKRKLVEYIKFLDDAAQTTEAAPLPTDPKPTEKPADTRRWSIASLTSPPHEEGYEAVDKEDVPTGIATGVGKPGEVVQRGWFSWGRSVSDPQVTQQTTQ